jgi:hypothetical protein
MLAGHRNVHDDMKRPKTQDERDSVYDGRLQRPIRMKVPSFNGPTSCGT